jgi:hypothetical protein
MLYKSWLDCIKFIDHDELSELTLCVKSATGNLYTLEGFSPHDSVDKVKAALMDKKGLRLVVAGRQLKEGTLADNNVQMGSRLEESGSLNGGGITKKHLTKDKALAELKHRAIENIGKQKEKSRGSAPDFVAEDVAEEIDAFTTRMEQSIITIKALKASGADIVAPALRSLEDDDLIHISEILAYKDSGRRESTEEKALMVLPLINKNLRTLAASAASMKLCERKMVSELLGIWAEEFHVYHEGQGLAVFNNVAFAKAVQKEMTTREIAPAVRERFRCPMM